MSTKPNFADMGKSEAGLVHLPSTRSVEDTVQRLDSILREHGIKVFALVDHSGEAEQAGLKMRRTKLLIFGNPKAGTPLMQAAPSIAIDLPLKALVWEDQHGKVWLTYNDPAYLLRRHAVPTELLPNLAGANTLMAKAAE